MRAYFSRPGAARNFCDRERSAFCAAFARCVVGPDPLLLHVVKAVILQHSGNPTAPPIRGSALGLGLKLHRYQYPDYDCLPCYQSNDHMSTILCHFLRSSAESGRHPSDAGGKRAYLEHKLAASVAARIGSVGIALEAEPAAEHVALALASDLAPQPRAPQSVSDAPLVSVPRHVAELQARARTHSTGRVVS